MTKESKLFHYFNDEIVIVTLAFIGGYVDAAGYIKLQNLFTSSITGNLVVACTSVYHTEGVFCRFWVSFSFAFGCAIVTSLAVRMKIVKEMNPKLVSITLFGLQLVVTLAALIIGLIFNKTIDNAESLNNWAIIVVGSLLGLSMGIHNAAAKESIPGCPSTTVMTMTLVTIASHAANALNYFLAKYSLCTMHPHSQTAIEHKIEEKFKDSLEKFVTSMKPLIAFLVGALTGASAMKHWGFWSLFVPMALNAAKMLDMYLAYRAATAPLAQDVSVKLAELRATHELVGSGEDSGNSISKDLEMNRMDSESSKSNCGTSCGEEECNN